MLLHLCHRENLEFSTIKKSNIIKKNIDVQNVKYCETSILWNQMQCHGYMINMDNIVMDPKIVLM